MIEGPPKLPTEEKKEAPLTKEQVVERLKANPEDLSPLNEYLDKREAEVSNSADTLQLIIETAEIYRDAGRVQAAIDSFTEGAEYALNIQDDQLCAYCEAELQKLGS